MRYLVFSGRIVRICLNSYGKFYMKKLLLSLSLISVYAFAIADESGSDVSKYYVNLNTGVATYQALPSAAWTGNLNIGYNVDSNLAFELGYNLIASKQYTLPVTTSIFDLAVKGTLPFNDTYALYGRAGIGFGMDGWSGDASGVQNCVLCQGNDSSYVLGLVGIGGSVAINKQWSAHLEDTMYIPFATTFAGSTINAVTIGAQYNF